MCLRSTLTKAQQEQEVSFSQDAYEAGDFVLYDQQVVNTQGRLQSGYGKEQPQSKFHGGTIFHDADTVLIWAEYQMSL